MIRHARRSGIAIPFVMGFAFLAGVFIVMIMNIRVEDKRQNLMTFQQLKSYYMAQGAIQHAMLKIRILPNEAYDVSALSRGICPLLISPPADADLDSARPKWEEGLAYYIGDINTDAVPLVLGRGSAANWSYTIDSARSLTSFIKTADDDRKRRKVNVLEFVALGTIEDKLSSNMDGAPAAEQKTRSERVTKVIEVTRSSR